VNTRDQSLLDRAFHEAERASWLWTAPNPRVGALALSQGHVIGHGHHAYLGGPHAEEAALRDAGAWQEDSNGPLPGVVDEMVITLEPCSATGGKKRRLHSCLELLQSAGVQRVVLGATDPDPRHQGAAIAAMREQGIEVIHAGQEERFSAQNPAFLKAQEHPQRPFVLCKWAASVDGRTATHDGVSQWITGEEARAEGHQLRAVSDAILVGARTLELDQPRLNARVSPEEPWQGQPLRVFLSASHLALADQGPLSIAGPRLWVECNPQATLPAGANEDDQLIQVSPDDSGRPSLSEVLSVLKEQGVGRLLIEGGSHVQAAFLRTGLLDAVVRYEAPSLFGGGLGSLQGEGPDHPQHAWQLFAEDRRDCGKDLRRAFLLRAADSPVVQE
jgi:diaminohydroxyphosphoribosylaminopyrimidine deaminase/5-amino-6-(5-phosphoribosylamino)uracil reductase